jgi:hypothetical protein
MDFSGRSITRVDPQVNFEWGNGSPDAAIAADTFSTRWTGQVQAQKSETYTFFVRADDGVRLWVNGQLLVNQWKDQGTTEYSGSIALVAGQKYDIRMEYYENSLGAVAQLGWSSASTPKQIIPSRSFIAARRHLQIRLRHLLLHQLQFRVVAKALTATTSTTWTSAARASRVLIAGELRVGQRLTRRCDCSRTPSARAGRTGAGTKE